MRARGRLALTSFESIAFGLLFGVAGSTPAFAQGGGAQTVAIGQPIETVGTRAMGMAGAFVAVADDATAVYWNPAGLVRSGIVHLSIDRQAVDQRPATTAVGGAGSFPVADQGDGTSTLVALGTPALGATYYRVRTTRVFGTSPAVTGSGMLLTYPSGAGASLVTDNVGGTLTQSLGQYLDVGTTIRFVRGVAAVSPLAVAGSAGDRRDGPLERAAELAGRSSQTVDLDLGAMLIVKHLRAGLLVRNLREPEFETTEPGIALSLDRQVRAGVAWDFGAGTAAGPGTTVVACDVDLTETEGVLGPQRHVAVGGERWWLQRRLGTRAGLRVNTIDDAQPSVSAGVSVGVTASLFVDGQISRGSDDHDRAWGVSLRFAY
jgi:hypothetical protein